MEKSILGKTGLKVSQVGFGGIPITRMDRDEAAGLVREAFALGFTFFDSAHLYKGSEAKLGQGLAGVRDQVVIATKTMARDAEGATAQLQQSLADLGTGYLDLYQLHNLAKPGDLDAALAPGGAYEAVKQAQDEGVVRHIGFSSHNPGAALAAIQTGLFATVQYAFNFIEQEEGGRVFAAARGQGMGTIAMKPLGGGLLERADLCFKFLQQHSEVVPIPGMQRLAEVEEIASLYRDPQSLTPADKREMSRIKAGLGERFCHRCGYCMPCPQGVQIPTAMLFKSQRIRFAPDQLQDLAGKAMATVEGCLDCGECTEKCPYTLPIPEMLQENYELYQNFLDCLPSP